MTLGLGINQISSANKWAGVEVAAVNQVSADIFKNAARVEKVDLSKANLNAFKRAELGIDLYSGKVDPSVQKQISLLSSGILNTQSSATLFLNAQAASTVYAPVSVQKTADVVAAKPSNNIFSSSIDKDKKGSNPFFSEAATAQGSKKENAQSASDNLSVFA